VEMNHPVCIAILDCNVILNEPNITKWNIVDGLTLFLVSDNIIDELNLLKKEPKSRDFANLAIKYLSDYFIKGDIRKGITVEGGWIISVQLPNGEQLDTQLKNIKATITSGSMDPRLVLLAKECDEYFYPTPVTLITAEIS
jgi:hypothetical protein